MLYQIKDFTDPFLDYIKDDPIRPALPIAKRISPHSTILVNVENNLPNAITCISFLDNVPDKEEMLFEIKAQPMVAVFYTIWSYSKGAGRQLIFSATDYIKNNYPNIERFVTLSPKTEMAHKFHISNGAFIFRENTNTINYEYLTSKIS
jgi:hypothetical protein